MLIRIQRGSSVPLSRQIEAQLRAKILSGLVSAEEQLPSVRELARELTVNVNTIVRVYDRLARDGLIDLRHGDGTYVNPLRKQAASGQLSQRRKEFEQELAALVRRGLMLGVTIEELPKLLLAAVENVRAERVSTTSSDFGKVKT